jgi:hypothetical protein
MLAALFGIILVGTSVIGFWLMLPKDGLVRPVATMPVLESVIPLLIIASFFVGAGFIFAGITSG